MFSSSCLISRSLSSISFWASTITYKKIRNAQRIILPIFITAHKRSCWKAMFSQAFVILSMGAGEGEYCLSIMLPRTVTPWDCTASPGTRKASGTHLTGMLSCCLYFLCSTVENSSLVIGTCSRRERWSRSLSTSPTRWCLSPIRLAMVVSKLLICVA